MGKKLFFDKTLLGIEDELAEINLTGYVIDLGPMLPGEEIIGELNDFEKKSFIWIEKMHEKIIEVVRGTANDLSDLDTKVIDQYVFESEILLSKIKILQKRVLISLRERFINEKSIGFRGNFKIVRSRQSEKDLEMEIEKLKEVSIMEVSKAMKKTNFRSC
ncbi:MAG: hypothetical protein WC688_07195 [Parachlamydiales bacterium]